MTTFLVKRTAPLFDPALSGEWMADSVAADAREWLEAHVGPFDSEPGSFPLTDEQKRYQITKPNTWDVICVWGLPECEELSSEERDDFRAVRLGTDDPTLLVYFKLRWA